MQEGKVSGLMVREGVIFAKEKVTGVCVCGGGGVTEGIHICDS